MAALPQRRLPLPAVKKLLRPRLRPKKLRQKHLQKHLQRSAAIVLRFAGSLVWVPATNPAQQEIQQAVVDEFNASQDEIELVLEVVPFDAAKDTLSTQIASGNGPDVVGPVGVGGSNAYFGQWLDYDATD